MHMAVNGAEVVHIQGDANNNVGGDQINNVYNLSDTVAETILHSLAEKAAANACYDSEQRFPPPNCHPGTRTKILGTLCEWIDHSSKGPRVCWLYGSAGVGKSAIAQNITEKYANSRLAAAFFFSRNDSSRDNLAPFVASIAYQFCKPGSPLKPVLGPMIIDALRSDPNIFHASCEIQFRKLIVEPCSKIELTVWWELPNLIVVDGLDECVHIPSQERLLAILREAVTTPFPLPLLFLVCSRPELQIRDGFGHENFDVVLGSLVIESTEEADRDIESYLLNRFNVLRMKHRALRHEDMSWPGDIVIGQLVNRADGQFIFAVTVIKYIDTRDEPPQDRLDTILRIRFDGGSESPYSDLDLLYRQILLKCQRWEKVQPILRLLVTSHETVGFDPWGIPWRSVGMIALLLNISKGQVVSHLSRLHSVLQIPEEDNSDIYIAHASFTEFLLDPNRSREYHIPRMTSQEYYDCVAILLLHTLSALKLHYPLYQHSQSLSEALLLWEGKLWREGDLMDFSCWNWYQYCTRVESPSPELLAALSEFDPHSVVSMLLYYNPFPKSSCWARVIMWAKSVRKGTEHFVEKLETFLRDFRVAFPPGISTHVAFWLTFELESFLGGLGYLRKFEIEVLRELYSVEKLPHSLFFGESHVVLVLPLDRPELFPRDWIVTHVKTVNAEVFRRVSDALDVVENGQRLLLEDIQGDTSKTVLQTLLEESDLIHLKSFINERLEVFGVSFDEDSLSDASFYSASSGKSDT